MCYLLEQQHKEINVSHLQTLSSFFGGFYRIVTEGEKKEVWRLSVENASTVMKPEEKDREQNIYRDVSSARWQFLSVLIEYINSF